MSVLELMGARSPRRGFRPTGGICVSAVLALLALGNYGRAEDRLPYVGASQCSVGVYLLSLSDVSLQDGTCVADFWVWFRWRNAEINPLETIEVIDGTIEEKTGESTKTLKDGFQYACHRVRVKLRQKWDVSRFPLDAQRIVIALEDAVLEAEEMILIADQSGSRVSPAVSVPGWSLGTFRVHTQTQAYETNYGDTDLPPGASAEYSRLIVTLDLFRPGMGLFFKLFTGLFVAVGIALVSIAVRPTDLDPRFGLPVGAMFASIASQYVIASVLPATSEFTLADQLHVLAVGVIFLVLLESVVSLLLTYADRGRIARRLDAACLAILLVAATAAVVILVKKASVPAIETLAALTDCSPVAAGDSVRSRQAKWRMRSGRSPTCVITVVGKYGPHESDAQLGAGRASKRCGTGGHAGLIDLVSRGDILSNARKSTRFDRPFGGPSLGIGERFSCSTRLLGRMETNSGGVVEIPASRYWIGDDSRVETSPRHLFTLEQPFWVDARPFTLGLLEEAVVSGALDSWADADTSGERSVDGLLRREIDCAEAYATANKSLRGVNLQDFPVRFVPWEAAALLCEKWGSRLPNEAEWEIAMRELSPLSRTTETSVGWLRKTLTAESERGCISCSGVCGEWTASPWSERYFAGAGAASGPASDGRVVVRGRLMSVFVRSAAATNCDEAQPTVFRRVWDDPDKVPTSIQVCS